MDAECIPQTRQELLAAIGSGKELSAALLDPVPLPDGSGTTERRVLVGLTYPVTEDASSERR